jgi:hypothetical protein
MLDRIVLLVLGIPLTAGGLGLTLSFGIFAFIGMPLLCVGLGCISAATAPATSTPNFGRRSGS